MSQSEQQREIGDLRDANLTRRNWLRYAGAIPGLLGPAAFLAQEANAESICHFAPKAKRVIHLFMNGGPFQADLFDPKPELHKYAGQRPESADLVTERPTGGLLPSPYKFKKCGKSGVPSVSCCPN